MENLTPLTTQAILPSLQWIDADTMGEAWTEAHWLRELPGKWQCSLVAYTSESSPAGFLVASIRENALHVHRLAVAAPYRGSGMGTAMLRRVARHASELGLAAISLKVNKHNERAQSLYERLGFSVVERTEHDLLMTVPSDTLGCNGITAD